MKLPSWYPKEGTEASSTLYKARSGALLCGQASLWPRNPRVRWRYKKDHRTYLHMTESFQPTLRASPEFQLSWQCLELLVNGPVDASPEEEV